MKNEQNDLPNIDTESLVDEPTLTLGVLLKKAREKKGASIEDIAAQLHLRPAIVREIEADNLSAVGAATYVRGYVKNYARAVQADPFEVQRCLDQQLQDDAEPSMQSFSRKTTRKARDGRLMFITYVIALALAALVVLWWVQKSSMDTTVDYSQPTVEEVAAASAEDVLANELQPLAQVTPARESSEQPLPLTVSNQAVTTASTEGNAAVMTPQSIHAQAIITDSAQPTVTDLTSPQDAHDGGTSTLVFALNGDCWMKVTDTKGNVLVEGLKQPGDMINLTGVAPFAVILGAPQAVAIELNGKPVSLAQYTRGKVARFNLPQAGQ